MNTPGVGSKTFKIKLDDKWINYPDILEVKIKDKNNKVTKYWFNNKEWKTLTDWYYGRGH